MFGDQQVSIIILCYQNYVVLNRAVSSVLEQNYPNIQLIISDDGSDFFDQYTLEKSINAKKKGNLKEYTILRNEKNTGTVQNLIRAMKAVKGDYYITLGADDALYDSSVVSTYVSTFQDHPDTWWVVGYTRVLSPDFSKSLFAYPDAKEVPVFKRRDAKELLSRWSCKGLMSGPAACFKKGIADLVGGYDEKYTIIEDLPLFFKLMRKGIPPFFIEKNVVKHATGGITKGNAANKDVLKRKVFIEDKYRILKNEVDAYPNQLINARDRREYKHYRKIIMDKTYVMEIEFAPLSRKEKIKMLFKRPKILFWVLQSKSAMVANIIVKATAHTSQWLMTAMLAIIAYASLTPPSSMLASGFRALVLFCALLMLAGLGAGLTIRSWRGIKKKIRQRRGY